MPSGTYVILAGFSSMAQLDTDPHTQAYRDALGDEGRSKMQKLVGDAIMSVGRMLFQFSPRMSVPPAWLSKGDPDFWTPKMMAPKKPGAKATQ